MKKKIQRIYWDASDIHKILRRISDEECEVIGFSRKFCRPDWLICSVFGVCPPSVRPSVRADNNTRMEDDLTHKYCDIIKTNRSLRQKLEQVIQSDEYATLGDPIRGRGVADDGASIAASLRATLSIQNCLAAASTADPTDLQTSGLA